jgi:DNA-directed RNA polymerase subunit L
MALKLDCEGMFRGENAFFVQRLTNASAIVLRLREHNDTLSSFLWQSLSHEEQVLITDYYPSRPSAEEAENVCIQALNRIVAGPCIYTAERFQNS